MKTAYTKRTATLTLNKTELLHLLMAVDDRLRIINFKEPKLEKIQQELRQLQKDFMPEIWAVEDI